MLQIWINCERLTVQVAGVPLELLEAMLAMKAAERFGPGRLQAAGPEAYAWVVE